jgi:hypothetical protein
MPIDIHEEPAHGATRQFTVDTGRGEWLSRFAPAKFRTDRGQVLVYGEGVVEVHESFLDQGWTLQRVVRDDGVTLYPAAQCTT